jgi:dihydrofolate reductase
LREGLIRDITLTRIPILLGDGIPLFGPLGHDVDLRHVETKAFASGLVRSKYEVVGAGCVGGPAQG